MEKNNRYNDLIAQAKELFTQVILDGFTDTSLIKFELLLQTILELDTLELYTNPYVLSLICLLDNKKSVLLKLSLEQMRLNIIKKSLHYDESVDNVTDDITCLQIGEDKYFEIIDGKKRYKNFDNEKNQEVHLISKNGYNDDEIEVVYKLDSNGFVISKHNTPRYSDDVNYDEIYLDSIEDVLKDDESQKCSENNL